MRSRDPAYSYVGSRLDKYGLVGRNTIVIAGRDFRGAHSASAYITVPASVIGRQESYPS